MKNNKVENVEKKSTIGEIKNSVDRSSLKGVINKDHSNTVLQA